MYVSIKLFGPEARVLGRNDLAIDVTGLPIASGTLRERVIEAEPRLAALLSTARFAVNHAFVNDEHMIGVNDEVAIINQVCGG